MSDTESLISHEDATDSSERRKNAGGGRFNIKGRLLFHPYHKLKDQSDTQPENEDKTPKTLSELRIVLVGKTGSGKSSTGNTILDEKCFKHDVSAQSVTQTCQKQDVEISGKKISVIDTPGLFDTSMTEDELSSAIEKCVEMSVPGPHVFLLIIRLDVRFTEEEKNTVKWIQENFGEDAARYTIILFTHADSLKAKTLHEYIKESQDLQVLIDKSSRRYHLFNNENSENRAQVTELLEKIEKMVLENGGDHYTNKMYQKAQKKIQDREKFWSKKPKIVLLGKTGSGKSSTGNTLVGTVHFKINNAQGSVTQTCEQQEGRLDRKTFSVIDTPGLIDKSVNKKQLKDEITKCLQISDPGPRVFLLVIKLVGRITDEEKNTVKAVKWIQENFEKDAVKYTIILFTHDDALKGKILDEYIRGVKDLQALVKKCGDRYHSFNNESKSNVNQVSKLLKKIEQMAESHKWNYYTNKMHEKRKTQRKKIKERVKKVAFVAGQVASVFLAGVLALGGATELISLPIMLIAGGLLIAARLITGTVKKKITAQVECLW